MSNTETPANNHATLGTISIARDSHGPFQIAHSDLNEHFYIIGRSGTGKSNLLKQLAIADMERGAGLCFIDPIGCTAEELLTHVPTRNTVKTSGISAVLPGDVSAGAMTATSPAATTTNTTKVNQAAGTKGATNVVTKAAATTVATNVAATGRDKDVIYIDAADVEFPIGINPLYNVAKEDRARAVSDILQMFESIWHDSGWGPRMESIFRATLHTLIENPNCMRPSLLTVFRLLLDSEFRHQTKQSITNPQLRDWWDYRFDRGDLNERTRREWVEPVLNKIDTLSLDPLIRNIIGQPRCSLDFEEIIRRKQILIVNLNQNKIGLDNASFIGMLIISRIRQAAAKVGKRDEPFTLTIDEAHSFPTMELSKIITQGRHTGLFIRIAHQHLDQFDAKISSALRNGCGSLAVFAVGHKDATIIVDDLESSHRERTLDLIRTLGNGEVVLRLTQNGAPQPPPSSPVKVISREHGSAKIQSAINLTRQRFATDRLSVEFQIATAHDQLSRNEHLEWKTRFKREQRSRGKSRRQHASIRVERNTKAEPSIGDLIFGDHNLQSP